MNPSAEYLALKSLNKPARSGPGDMWLNRRLGIVKVFNATKRGTRRGTIYNNFHLYHWGKPSLTTGRPCNWRDDDPNSCSFDPAIDRWNGEKWEYVGNIFDMLPFAALSQKAPQP